MRANTPPSSISFGHFDRPYKSRHPPTVQTPSIGQLKNWLTLISITSVSQLAIQAIGFVSGIIVIRLLPVQEYAIYTIANTMLGLMTMLSDGGIQNGVMAQGGKVWKDKASLGAVMATGMILRQRFATFSLILVLPCLIYLLQAQQVSWGTSGLIALCLIPAFISTVTGATLEVGPLLHQDIPKLQRIGLASNGARLALTGLTLFCFPFAAIALLSAGVAQAYGNLRLRKISASYVDIRQEEDLAVRREILSIVKRVMPAAIYYAISGQAMIWLLSIFGSTEALADAGALSRLAMLLGVFSSITAILIVPRYARLQLGKATVLSYFFKVEAVMLFIATSIFLLVWSFPKEALWILGENYNHLGYELILLAGASVINFVSATCGSLNATRGALFSAKILLAVSVTSNLLILTIDYTSLRGLLVYSLLVSIINLIYNNVCALVMTNANEKTAP